MPTCHAADGHGIYYEVEGVGPPVLLIMGYAVDMTGWLLQRPAFAERHRVVLLDNRGVGRSGKPEGPYTSRQMAGDAVALLDHLGIERAGVAGLSMGGMIAQWLAIDHPERVASLALCATYARPGQVVLGIQQDGMSHFGIRRSAEGLTWERERFDPTELFQFLLPLTFSQRFVREHTDLLFQLAQSPSMRHLSKRGLLGQTHAVMTHDASPHLSAIHCPTLVFHGTDDLLIPFEHAQELRHGIEGAQFVALEGGTHGFNFEAPEAFNQTVLDFLAQTTSS